MSVIHGPTGGRCAPREERNVCARRADERALRPWPPHHPLHWAVSARAPLRASRSQLPPIWANPQVSLLALALWGQRGGAALCSPGLERDSVPPAAGGGRTPTMAISDKHKLVALGHIHVACGWLRLHPEDSGGGRKVGTYNLDAGGLTLYSGFPDRPRLPPP